MLVDDIVITRNNKNEKQALKWILAKAFEIKELEKLKYFLGIKMAHLRQGIFISQQKYVINILKETRKLACKYTPIDPNHKLEETNEDVVVEKEMYQRLVERHIYLSHT